ncbi:MAG: hypothetical protein J0L92_00030 [Deltaproteobacteria bacterium]|nr:hypothetical protein [Deltaproteobacteria bacterium]
MANEKSERSRGAKRHRATTFADLDHRAMGKEIVRTDRREPPIFLAVLFSLAAPLLLASLYNLQHSVLLGVIGIAFGGLGTWAAVDMWRAVARDYAWNRRNVEIVYGLRSVVIEDRDGAQTLSFAEASMRPEVTRWARLRDLMRVRETHSRMDPKTPERLILEWLALTQTSFERAGPLHVLWRGPEEAPVCMSAETSTEEQPLYRVELVTDVAGNTRPRWDHLPRRVQGR